MASDREALRLLIVDDEALARLRLRQLLPLVNQPATEVLAEAADVTQALALLRRHEVDAVLLDIAMPGQSGMALAQALRSQRPHPAVIFVTAHAAHAVQAFEVQATDYLTKPVRLARLQEALMRVWEQRRAGVVPPAPPAADSEVLLVHERGRVLRLPHAEIVSLRAELKTVLVRTATAAYVVDESLAELEQRLGEGFVRVHRNALVARTAIRSLELRPDAPEGAVGDGWAVQLGGTGEWFAVSRRQLGAVKAALEARAGEA
jgi:two-component system response regulator AlgR